MPEVLEYVRQKTIHEWLKSDTGVVQRPEPPREKLSNAAKRRASAADCKGSQRKIFDVVFEPVMTAINEQMEARKAGVEKEKAKLRARQKEVGAETESPSKMTSPEKKKFK